MILDITYEQTKNKNDDYILFLKEQLINCTTTAMDDSPNVLVYIYNETKHLIHEQLKIYINQSIHLTILTGNEIHLDLNIINLNDHTLDLICKYIKLISCELIPPNTYIDSCE